MMPVIGPSLKIIPGKKPPMGSDMLVIPGPPVIRAAVLGYTHLSQQIKTEERLLYINYILFILLLQETMVL